MSTFIKKVNPVTGQTEQVGGVMLKAIPSSKFLEYTNGEGETKRYKLANGQVEINGKDLPLTVSIAEKTIERMEESKQEFNVGETYLTTLSRVPSTVNEGEFVIFARMSHLQGLPTAHKDISDAFDWEATTTATSVEAKEPAVTA